MKRQTYPKIRMRINDTRGSLKKVSFRDDFHEYLRAYWQRILHVEIASIDTYLVYANFYPRATHRLADLGVSNEWNPLIPPALFDALASVPR